MQVIARSGNYTLSSSFGTSISEGSRLAGTDGKIISFEIGQVAPVYNSFWAKIEPVTGSYSDFWEDFFSNRIGGEPADDFALFRPVSDTVSFKINPDTIIEQNETFKISIYLSNLDPIYGAKPLVTAQFTIRDDDSNPVASPGGLVAAEGVHRFFNTQTGGHFFTVSDAEAAQVIATRPDLKLEGIGFGGFATDQGTTTEEVYRFFNTRTGGHFFTTSENERDTVIATNRDYELEGVGFYNFTSDQGASTEEVYRFFNTKTGGHFFTASEAERDQVIATNHDYQLEGIAFYAPSDGALLLV